MQKLILQYERWTDTDDFSWSAKITSPFLYSSKKEAIIDLKILIEKQKTTYVEFMFAGLELTTEPFGLLERGKIVGWSVNIKTLEEWFEQELPK
jgi:hypothetical protein